MKNEKHVLWFILICGWLLCSLKASKSKKKEIMKLFDFIENEKNSISKQKASCSLNSPSLKSVAHLRLLEPQSENTFLCYLKFLENNPNDGFVWSALGHLYLQKPQPQTTQANFCFKQAVKQSTKNSLSVNEWYYIGPFVIGKMELDGDPLAAYGGIRNVSLYRLKKNNKYLSEIVPNGEVKWKVYRHLGESLIRISPELEWNDLVGSLGSMGITEWQGWIVGEFAINEKEQTVIIQCHGLTTAYVDKIPIVGDVYHRDQLMFSITLTRGIHTLYAKLRAKVNANFKCVFKTVSTSFDILSPTMVPDLVDGYLFSQYLSIPVINFLGNKWLKNIGVSLKSQSYGQPVTLELVDKRNIAPGQILGLIISITSTHKRLTSGCYSTGIDLVLEISTSEGSMESAPINLRCRKLDQSFLFSFIDHDGSVQQGAAIAPITKCVSKLCPVLLTLHGTSVPAQNQADSYKRMVGKDFEFGFDTIWLLAPTRHGAHNWEGPGALTAMTALEKLRILVQSADWIDNKVAADHVIFSGHSMGGHGAWHLATHFPDRALAVVSLAGWIKKEEYGDSNLFFRHDISASHTDPSVKAIMEAAIAENDADRHVSNLKGIPVLARIGENDRTVHPYFVRRMFRLISELKTAINYTELSGKEHWWWDTWSVNDGGAVHDQQLRSFAQKHGVIPEVSKSSGSCSVDKEHCSSSNQYSITASQRPVDGHHTLVTLNPAFGESVHGIRVLQQITPFRTTTIDIHQTGDSVQLQTSNVAKFQLVKSLNRAINWTSVNVVVDADFTVPPTSVHTMMNTPDKEHLCRAEGEWSICTENRETSRDYRNYGPARRVAEKPFLIVTGTLGSVVTNQILLQLAVYISNHFWLSSDTSAAIVKDTEVPLEKLKKRNLIIIGGPKENSLTSEFLKKIPINIEDNKIILEKCKFKYSRSGILSLVPNGLDNLALLLIGQSFEGLLDIVSLATPTIPPMCRSPFSNLIPDFVITGPSFPLKGPGGFLCTGFWGNEWEFRADISSCSCHA
ncbi:secreted ARB_06907-like [Octopus vulgaris]|uniref:Secreted ARB_06907-like n=1 Tax=Octopus vulgaris TaxID=6645 RepID=A0AA36B9Z9_OCTVU|nr:secreted ARB_06907-like [Octopus vulgaris]